MAFPALALLPDPLSLRKHLRRRHRRPADENRCLRRLFDKVEVGIIGVAAIDCQFVFDVLDHCQPVLHHQFVPARHGRAANTARNGAQQITVVGHRSGRREPELKHPEGEITRPVDLYEGRCRAIAVAFHAVASKATALVDVLAIFDPIVRTRQRYLRRFQALRLESVAPFATVGAELLQVSNQRFQIFACADQAHHFARELVVGCEYHRIAAALRNIHQPFRVGCEQDFLVAIEIKQLRRFRRVLDGTIALRISHDVGLVRTIKQRGKARHDGIRRKHARIPEMRQMPGIAVLETDARQVRPDAPRGEQVRHVKGILTGLRNRSPASRLAGYWPDVLRMTVPATLADIDFTTALLQRGVFGGMGLHPFELAQVGSHYLGDARGTRLRL